MEQHSQGSSSLNNDPEATLVAPRFDAEEARRAHPVVPLAEARGRTYFVATHRPARSSGLRRSWSKALVAVVMLAVVAVGGVFATKVLRRPQANAQAEAAQTDAAQTEAAPAQAAGAEQQKTPLAPQAPREEARAKRTAGRARAAEAAMIPAQAEESLRGDDDREKADDKDDDRRGRGRDREKRRERDDDDGRREARAFEKEMRKALKQEKDGKAARLVDVIIGP